MIILSWSIKLEKQKLVSGEISERALTLRTVASTTMIVTISVAHPKGLAKELLFDFTAPSYTSKITHAKFQFEIGLLQTLTLYTSCRHTVVVPQWLELPCTQKNIPYTSHAVSKAHAIACAWLLRYHK